MSEPAAITPVTVADLRAIDLFDGLDDAALAPWAAAAAPRRLRAGEVLSDVGEPAKGFHLLLEGELEILHVEGGDAATQHRNVAPTWIGAIPSLTSGFHRVRMQAATDARVATIPRDAFVDLVRASRPVFERVMAQVRPVVARVTAIEHNRERLASLGTMAAGLTHEINNPAAAARRAAAELQDVLAALGRATERFVAADLDPARARELSAMKQALLEQAVDRDELDALAAADAEEALSQALERLDVEEPWRCVEPLVAAGVDPAWLERLAAVAGPEAAGAAVSWIGGSLQARRLTDDLTAATDRIGELVRAVKQYAYMDRGGLVEIDLNEGIVTTLIVLKHKLRHTAIRLEKRLAPDLPRMTVHGSELNQVWTNLIDNAIDALDGAGTLTVRSRRDGDCVVVEIGDDGPGIPPEAQARVFDPFFTTKDVGAGTGLGLDTARRIVVDRHRGSLWVDSRPGRTVFSVSLPIDQPRR